jgi:hypothetical protein
MSNIGKADVSDAIIYTPSTGTDHPLKGALRRATEPQNGLYLWIFEGTLDGKYFALGIEDKSETRPPTAAMKQRIHSAAAKRLSLPASGVSFKRFRWS